jgi:hypothetical protein
MGMQLWHKRYFSLFFFSKLSICGQNTGYLILIEISVLSKFAVRKGRKTGTGPVETGMSAVQSFGKPLLY